MNSDVWVNGKHLGHHPFGYTPFNYDLTDHLTSSGQKDVVAVRVNNTGQNSRWYSGSGIFRHVHLVTTPLLRVAQWGVTVATVSVSADGSEAVIAVNVTL